MQCAAVKVKLSGYCIACVNADFLDDYSLTAGALTETEFSRKQPGNGGRCPYCRRIIAQMVCIPLGFQ